MPKPSELIYLWENSTCASHNSKAGVCVSGVKIRANTFAISGLTVHLDNYCSKVFECCRNMAGTPVKLSGAGIRSNVRIADSFKLNTYQKSEPRDDCCRYLDFKWIFVQGNSKRKTNSIVLI